jgi:hypothetical protein
LKKANRRGAEIAEETQRKALTAQAGRRKEKPQSTSEFLILLLFSSASLRSQLFFLFFPGG